MSDAYKIFKQLQEREKEAQQYEKYEREDLIDEIIDLQQENQRLKEENERLKQTTIFIDTQDMEERYGEELYKEYLEKENTQLKDVIEEVREYMKENRTCYIYQDSLGEDWRFDDLDVYSELLQILDKAKGEDND